MPLPQVVHQQVPDRAAGQVVAVDELLAGSRPANRGLSIRPSAGRRREDRCVQQLVEDRASPAIPVSPGNTCLLALIISRQSPTVTSRAMPPFEAMITATF